jgi:hypothetical protein
METSETNLVLVDTVTGEVTPIRLIDAEKFFADLAAEVAAEFAAEVAAEEADGE